MIGGLNLDKINNKQCINSICKHNDIEDRENFGKCDRIECAYYVDSNTQKRQALERIITQIKQFLFIVVIIFIPVTIGILIGHYFL